MRERTRPWPTGTPTWVDLSANDPVAATASYEELLGWKCVRQGEPEYWSCSVDGRDVAGIGTRPADPGAVRRSPRGRMTILLDAESAPFAVIRLS